MKCFCSFEITPHHEHDLYAIAFDGYLQVPASGIYTFCDPTDDGCRIIIGDEIIHEANGRHGMEEYQEKVTLEKGLQKIKLLSYRQIKKTNWLANFQIYFLNLLKLFKK